MKLKKIYLCSLALIFMLSVIPALSECSDCSGGKCFTSQFSFSCRFGCKCHRSMQSTSAVVTPTVTPTVSPSDDNEDIYYGTNNSLESEIVRQVNIERKANGLGELRLDPELSQAAYIRAVELTKSFSHTRPDGTSWRTVSAAARGENIARGYNSADKVMAAWFTSEGHRANILREGFGSIGVCAIEHNGVLYWVQIFGS